MNTIETRPFGSTSSVRNAAWLWIGIAFCLAVPVRGAVLSWGGGGATGNWSLTDNWGFAGVPAAGDTLIFPSSAARLSNTNDIAGLVLSEIRFAGANGGFNIYGNVFTLTNGIQATNTIGGNAIYNPINFSNAPSVTLTVGTSATLSLGGALGGSAAVVKSGAGNLVYFGTTANTYTNVTTVNQGKLTLSKTVSLDMGLHGPLVIGDGVGGANADIVALGGIEQMYDQIPVTINSSGLLDLAGTSEFFGSLAGNGNVTLGGASPRIGVNNSSTVFDGIISGSGSVMKRGTGTLTLTGASTYSLTQIDNGKVVFNGSMPTNVVIVTGGTSVGGNGTIGILSVQAGATVAPGTSPGILSCSNVAMAATSTLSVELNGIVPGFGYDRLRVQGTNNINGVNLVLSNGPSFVPLQGDPLTILENDKTDAITGTFTNLPEGSIVQATNGLKFRISYIGGDGNDITLTLTNPPSAVIGVQAAGGNGNSFIDVNECNDLRLIITNLSGVPMTGIKAKLASATAGVDVTQPDSTYPNIPAGGTGTNLVAFQMSTQPFFACGAPITLNLSLVTDSNSFAVPFTFASSSAFPPVRFDYDISTNIADFTTNDLPVVVSGISNPIVKVTVSLFASHTFDQDLIFFLIGPNGTTVELSSANGGAGDNYGTACGTEALRTTFDDAAATSITAGTAPFTNSYRAESPLYAFTGFSGTDVNGTWKLRVIDSASGDTGTLKCWSLFLSQLSCPSGGGACPICANMTIAGAIGEGDPFEVDRLLRLAAPGTCGATNICPGPVNHGSMWYEAFTYQNGPSNACINVSLAAPTTDLFSAAYLGNFNPTNICNNYLADSGNSTGDIRPAPAAYSFVAPSNAVFVVIVNSVDGAAGPFQLSVTGGDCRPVLRANPWPVNQVKVDWPAYAAGYLLEASPSLGTTNWATVTNVPGLSGGRYGVTNTFNPTNRFYRLRKPL